MDGGYLKKHVGAALPQCLCEVVEKRPYDPIEYIGQWLYKYVANKKFEQQRAVLAAQLLKEQKEYELEQEMKEIRRQEAERLAAIEAALKKAEEEHRAREAASAVKLSIVEEREESTAGEREEEGQEQPEENTTEENPSEAVPVEIQLEEAEEGGAEGEERGDKKGEAADTEKPTGVEGEATEEAS